jgi:hypothetical protein
MVADLVIDGRGALGRGHRFSRASCLGQCGTEFPQRGGFRLLADIMPDGRFAPKGGDCLIEPSQSPQCGGQTARGQALPGGLARLPGYVSTAPTGFQSFFEALRLYQFEALAAGCGDAAPDRNTPPCLH